MKRFVLALLATCVPTAALAQSAVTQNGTIVQQHLPLWRQDRQIGDVGGLLGQTSGPFVGRGASPFSITDDRGPGLRFNDAVTTGSHNYFTFGHNSAGAAVLDINGTQRLLADIFPGGTIYTNPVTFGADPAGITDSTAAFNAACASWGGGKGVLAPSPGVYKLTGNITCTATVAGAQQAFILYGTTLRWDAAGGLILNNSTPFVANYNCYTGSIKVLGADFQTMVSNGGNALTLNSTSTCGNSSGAPVNTVDIKARGDGVNSYWTRGIYVNQLSNINYTGGVIGRSALGVGLGPAGIGIETVGAVNKHSVMHNMKGMNFVGLEKGYLMSTRTEGVTINGGTNFTSISPGCAIEVNGANTLQLMVSNSQFGISSGHICVNSDFVGLNVSNNFMISFGGNKIIDLGPHVITGSVIQGNHFLSGDVAASNALLMRNTSGTAIFCSNYLQWIGTGIRVESATAGFDVRCDSNHMDFLTSPKLVENVANSPNVWFPDVTDITMFGANCSGPFGADMGPALAVADATFGLNKIGISKSCRLTTNRTIAHPIYIGKNGVITIDAGIVLTPSGGVEVNTFLPFAGAGSTSYGAQIAFGTGVTGTQLFYGPDLRFPALPTSAGASGTVWRDPGAANVLKVSP